MLPTYIHTYIILWTLLWAQPLEVGNIKGKMKKIKIKIPSIEKTFVAKSAL
jgi:hypothetical protein